MRIGDEAMDEKREAIEECDAPEEKVHKGPCPVCGDTKRCRKKKKVEGKVTKLKQCVTCGLLEVFWPVLDHRVHQFVARVLDEMKKKEDSRIIVP